MAAWRRRLQALGCKDEQKWLGVVVRLCFFLMPMPLLKTNRTKPGRRGCGHDETERNQERNRKDPPEKEVVDGRRPQAFPPSIESKSQAESSKKVTRLMILMILTPISHAHFLQSGPKVPAALSKAVAQSALCALSLRPPTPEDILKAPQGARQQSCLPAPRAAMSSP